MNCLLEIGIENFPAQYLNESLKSLKEALQKLLNEQRVSFSDLEVLGTSRRIVVKFKILKDTQEDLNIEILGPSLNIALDEKGQFNNVAKSFAESRGYSIDHLKIKETPKGKCISISSIDKGKKVREILPKIFEKAILSLEFNKTMNWNSFQFIRPINWLLSFIDNEVLNFSLGNVNSNNFTYANKSLSLEKIYISSYEDYFQKLEELAVILFFEKRKEKIVEFLKNINSERINEEIVERNVNVSEFPNPIICNFDESFLTLPSEIIVRTLEEHQNAIPIFKEGKLTNQFVVIRDGLNINEKIKKGNERVVKARLTDAQFFYNEDIKHPLEYYNNFLDTILFQKELGNMKQKVERIVSFSNKLSANFNIDKDSFIKAANLCKADLATNVVKEKEYKILKGYIGMCYASKYGENVSKPIFEHYLPRFKDDILPSNLEGAILSIIDKIDNITAVAILESLPTGAKDPFYLRREAIALIEVILKFGLNFSLIELFQSSFKEYKAQNLTDKEFNIIKENLEKFMKNRVESYLTEKYPKSLVNSVMNYCDNIKDLNGRLKILNNYYENENFKNIVEIAKRVKNITKNFNSIEIDKDLLKEKEEIDLYNQILELRKVSESKNYDNLFKKILNLKEPLNKFFDNVIVNVEKKEIKNNRLSLLKALDKLINYIADISLC